MLVIRNFKSDESLNKPDQHDGHGSSHILVPKHVQEARVWIAAWKQRTGRPKMLEGHMASAHKEATADPVMAQTSEAPSLDISPEVHVQHLSGTMPGPRVPTKVFADGSMLFTAAQLMAGGPLEKKKTPNHPKKHRYGKH